MTISMFYTKIALHISLRILMQIAYPKFAIKFELSGWEDV